MWQVRGKGRYKSPIKLDPNYLSSFSVTGELPSPAPIRSFAHAGFDRKLLAEIARQGFEAPTAIQAQALPVILRYCNM